MPMVDLTLTPGALDEETKQALAGELARILLDFEAAPFNEFGEEEHMRALSWCFVSEQDMFMGGIRHDKPAYRVVLTVPEGAPVFGPLAAGVRAKMFERVTEAVLAAEGTEVTMAEAHRVWVQLRHIVDTQWGGFGEVITINDLRKYAFERGEPGSKPARMREAALVSVRSVAR